MKLSGFAPILSSMFTDKMDIRRYEDSLNDDGTTDTKLSLSPVYSDVPCRISFSSEDNPRDTEIDDIPVRNIPKLFCNVGVDIRAGDVVTIRRLDDAGVIIATLTGKVGLPSVFITHKEALLSIEESA